MFINKRIYCLVYLNFGSLYVKTKINRFVGSIEAFIGFLYLCLYSHRKLGSKVSPFPAAFCCRFLSNLGYGLLRTKKDWTLIFPNAIQVILGGLTFLTSL